MPNTTPIAPVATMVTAPAGRDPAPPEPGGDPLGAMEQADRAEHQQELQPGPSGGDELAGEVGIAEPAQHARSQRRRCAGRQF
jgi:hypothetical protein